MIAPLDIYRNEPAGGVVWLATALNFDDAKAIVKDLHAKTPGAYFVRSQTTGNTRSITVEDLK